MLIYHQIMINVSQHIYQYANEMMMWYIVLVIYIASKELRLIMKFMHGKLRTRVFLLRRSI